MALLLATSLAPRHWALLAAPLGAQEPEPPAVPSGSAVVTGKVFGEEVEVAVRSAEVTLHLADDSTLVGTAVTDTRGRFRIEDAPEGTFFVRLRSLGYGTVATEPFEVAAAEVRALGELRMPVDALEVDRVTVSTERSVVTHEADRDVYNVGVMPGTGGAPVTETLSRIADLQVDIDGRVTLRGQGVTIYIDGRDAPLSGETLTLFMEQFPSDLIQEIEVIHNPPARYDAEGTGGIVNLVTREGVELGVSGTVFSRADTRGQYTVGGHGVFQRGAWTVNGRGSVGLSDRERSDYQLRQNLDVEPAYLRQDAWSDRSGLSTSGNLEVAYEPTERARLYLEGGAWRSGHDQEGATTTTHLADLETPILAYDRSRASDSRSLNFDLATGFQRSWTRADQELEVEVALERGRDRQERREEVTDGTGLEGDQLIPAELTLEDENELETALSGQADYVRAWGEDAEIELGYQGERTEADQDRLLRFVEDPGTATDEGIERGHRVRERSHALYGTVERRLGPASVQVGLRAETAALDFELPDGRTFDNRYLNLFPSANVSYRIDDERRLRISYSRRVNRPGLSVLNPVDTSTDPLERRVGNPDIEPQLTHRLTMSATWSTSTGSLRLSPHLSATRNGWSRLTTVDDRGVSTRTYGNVTSRESYGASLSYRIHRWHGWAGDVSLSARRQNRDASNLEERYSGTATRLSSRVNIDGRVTDDFRVQGSFSYQPGQDLPQGRTDARIRADFGARYRLLDDRASVRLSLRDPFALQQSSSRLRDTDYVLIGRSQQSTRSAQISVSYTFVSGGASRGGRRRGRP
ncbi:MAG: TonB-dependent receptor [Gemmatimonadota bacterium]|nr:TonB-dependent receptor [Gemmatimonadota bacterium]